MGNERRESWDYDGLEPYSVQSIVGVRIKLLEGYFMQLQTLHQVQTSCRSTNLRQVHATSCNFARFLQLPESSCDFVQHHCEVYILEERYYSKIRRSNFIQTLGYIDAIWTYVGTSSLALLYSLPCLCHLEARNCSLLLKSRRWLLSTI
jgi:hypothetical protein